MEAHRSPQVLLRPMLVRRIVRGFGLRCQAYRRGEELSIYFPVCPLHHYNFGFPQEVQTESLAQYDTPLLEKEHPGCFALPNILCFIEIMFDENMACCCRLRIFLGCIGSSPKSSTVLAAFKRQRRRILGSWRNRFLCGESSSFMANMTLMYQNVSRSIHTSIRHLKKPLRSSVRMVSLGCSRAELLAPICNNITPYLRAESIEAARENVEDLSRIHKFSKITRGLEPISSMFKTHVTNAGTTLVKKAEDSANDKVVRLLAYISDKVLFAEFYRKKLARRLLFDKSANDEHEGSILTKLKQQCGASFLQKWRGMVTNLTITRDHQTKVEEFVAGHPELNPGIDLVVTVLATGLWASYQTFDINLPAEMVSSLFDHFESTITFVSWNMLAQCSYLKWIYLCICQCLLGEMCRGFQGVLPNKNKAQEAYLDIFLGNLCCDANIAFLFMLQIPIPPVDEKKKAVHIMKRRKVMGHEQLVAECVEQLSHMFECSGDNMLGDLTVASEVDICLLQLK
ncbi:Cullin-1, partial [Dichanthelium oligosanthes]